MRHPPGQQPGWGGPVISRNGLHGPVIRPNLLDVKRLSAALLALLLCGCGGHTNTLDQQRLEGQIKAWAVKQSGPNTRVKVSCPGDIPIKAGTDFHCLVSDQHGTSIRLTVTIENDQGYVTWTTS